MESNRVKELAKQAGMEDYPTYGVDCLYGEKDVEKFAQLIIQECIDVLNREARLAQIQLVADTSYGVHALAALTGGIGAIKRHFELAKN